MIDHISLRVSDLQRSRAFYEAALAPLGYTVVFSNDQEQYAGFAGPDRERIWIGHREGASHGYAHIAVLAKDRATVRKFYEAAMKAGGRDNGGGWFCAPRKPPHHRARSFCAPRLTIHMRCFSPR